MITFAWEMMGVPLAEMARATADVTDLISKALRRHGSATAWIWVHENGGKMGGHCHLLVHIPPELVPMITKLSKKWMRTICGQPYRKGALDARPIGGRLGVDTSNPHFYAENMDKVLGYVLKGASSHAAAQFGLRRLKPGGQIIGKRCSTSQNIGRKARAAFRAC